MPESPNAVRAAKNENIFRELNDHLEAVADTKGGDGTGFVCECSSITCAELVTLTLAEYAHVRESSDRFFVTPDDDHVDDAYERVIERYPTHWVVEKVGVAGDVAERLDDA
jgi:hypothetical protein